MENCKVCESKELKKKFIKEGTWCGTKAKPEEHFNKSEYDFGWDYYPKHDLLNLKCKECGYSWYEKANKI
jgi:hypothetical protein